MTDAMTLHKQYLAVFDGPAGKAVLADLMRRGGLLAPSYNADPLRMAFNEGKRIIALHIHSMLDTQAVNRVLSEQGEKTK
jgi:hypothetical protein